jgi:hypothetical protein|uniref:Uncharacterized protein n=1 Tax=viral metagenome TaxID=1070528 RepID=A0A6C0BEZ9_9ZZZZ
MVATTVNTQKLAYIDTWILSCRIHGMYKKSLRQDFISLKSVVNDTLNTIRTAHVKDKEIISAAIPLLYMILVDIAMKRYDNVHNTIREIKYLVVRKYQRDRSYIYNVDGKIVTIRV